MHVTVTYRAQLKRAVGRPSERIEVAPGSTTCDLVARLADSVSPDARTLLLDESVLVFVGDEQADGARPLHDGDEVTLLAPMAGG